MEEQIERVIHLGFRYPNSLAEDAAIDILDILGFDNGKCLFLSSGSEAVEFAVQAARRLIEKPLLLTFSTSYLGAYGSAGRKSGQEWWLLDLDACGQTEINECMQGIPFEDIGAFVFEPGGSGSAFVNFPPERIVHEIASRIKQERGLIVVNEITTGMGRTGKWFGFQHYDIQPDIVSLGKGLGNGYPVSAVAMQPEIAEKIEASGFRYVQSHQNDPLGCRIAQEVIAVLHEDNLIQRGREVGTFFLEGLIELQDRYDLVKEARGRGMLLGLELQPHENLTVQSIYATLLEQGYLVGYYSAGNLLRFDPALTIQIENITRLLESLDKILNKASK